MARIHSGLPFRSPSFPDIADHYIKTELPDRACSTAYLHRHIVNDFLIPRWGKRIAVGLKPLEVEEWLKTLRAELEFLAPFKEHNSSTFDPLFCEILSCEILSLTFPIRVV